MRGRHITQRKTCSGDPCFSDGVGSAFLTVARSTDTARTTAAAILVSACYTVKRKNSIARSEERRVGRYSECRDPSAAQFRKYHRILVQDCAADRDQQQIGGHRVDLRVSIPAA